MNSTRRFHIALAASAILIGSACGSTSTTSTADTAPALDSEPAVAVAAAPTTATPTTAAPTTAAPEPAAPPSTVVEPAPAAEPEPAPEPEPEPESEPIDDLAAPPSPPSPCGSLSPIPASATITADLMVDVRNDGTADDRVVSYLDGSWKLRSVIDGVTSEVVIDDVGPGAVRVLGVADVGVVNDGNEIIATTGAGASTTEIGVFGDIADGCLAQYTWQDTTPLAFRVGGGITHGDSTWCGDGYIGATSYEQDEWGTYSAGGAAYEEKSLGVFGYITASDDYSEGMAYDDLTPVTFDCFGLTL